jgi:hypothetical protein
VGCGGGELVGGVIRVNERFELPYMSFERDIGLRGWLVDAVQQHLVGIEWQEKSL